MNHIEARRDALVLRGIQQKVLPDSTLGQVLSWWLDGRKPPTLKNDQMREVLDGLPLKEARELRLSLIERQF